MSFLKNIPKILFFALIVKPMITFILGVSIRHKERLKMKGPLILVANHNSHLDTMVLMNLFPLKILHQIRPAAAMDFFFKTPLMSLFATYIIGALPVSRHKEKNDDPLAPIKESLAQNQIVIFFPEGTRGEPEVMGEFKKGIAKLAKENPSIPIVPLFLYGLGKSLPKNDFVIVPFIAKVIVGEEMYWNENDETFLLKLESKIKKLGEEAEAHSWLYQ